jgi:hypothetical protein
MEASGLRMTGGLERPVVVAARPEMTATAASDLKMPANLRIPGSSREDAGAVAGAVAAVAVVAPAVAAPALPPKRKTQPQSAGALSMPPKKSRVPANVPPTCADGAAIPQGMAKALATHIR